MVTDAKQAKMLRVILKDLDKRILKIILTDKRIYSYKILKMI